MRARLATQGRVVAALSRRSIMQAFRRPQFLAPILVFPSLFLAVNTGGAGRAVDLPAFPEVHGFLDFQLAGSMLQSTMLAGVSAGIALALDIEIGFIDRLVVSPISRGDLHGRPVHRVVRAAQSADRLAAHGRDLQTRCASSSTRPARGSSARCRGT